MIFIKALHFFTGIIGNFVLVSLGWSVKHPKTFENRMVVINWPHTTYYESFILLMTVWHLRLNTNLPPTITLMTAWMFSNPLLGMIAKLYGGIKATPVCVKKGGQTSSIIKDLNRRHRFVFTIVPSGKIGYHNNWRSGWKIIAEQTKSKIYHVNVDFVENIISLHDVAECTKGGIKEIEQGVRECGFTTPETPKNYIDILTFTSMVCGAIVASATLDNHPILCLPFLLQTVISTYYHNCKETDFRSLDVTGAYICSALLAIRLYITGVGSLFYYGIYLCGLSLYCYREGCPRSNGRTYNYILNHSLFHIVGSLGIYFLLR